MIEELTDKFNVTCKVCNTEAILNFDSGFIDDEGGGDTGYFSATCPVCNIRVELD